MMPATHFVALLGLTSLSLAASPILVERATTAHTPAATVTAVTGDVSGNLNSKQLIPVQDPILKALVGSRVPDHLNVSCDVCSTTGSIEVDAGGWTSGDSAMSIGEEFMDNGFLKFIAHGLSADIEPSIKLLPGFQAVNIEVPVVREHIKTIDMSSKASMDFWLLITLPLVIQLNTEVDISPKMKVEIPEGASIFLDIGGNNGGDSIHGFEKTKLTPGFNINAPNISVSMLNGVNFKLQANASYGSTSLLDFNATLSLPQYNTTVSAVQNVNDRCQTAASGQKSFAQAVHVQYAVGYNLGYNGQVLGGKKKVPYRSLSNGSLSLADGCFAWDQNSLSVKAAVSAASSSLSPAPRMVQMIGFVGFVAAAVMM